MTTWMSIKLKKAVHFTVLISLAVTALSCSNVFTPYLAQTDTNAALFYEAKMLVDQRKYSAAQSTLLRMTDAYFAKREVQVLYASTYAGLCGLDFINLILSISNLSGSLTLFQLLFSVFTGSNATTVSYCVQAEQILAPIVDSTTDIGTVDEHFLMIFISLAKIGNIMNYVADSDQDGAIDGTFNKCTDAELTDLNVAEISVSLARIFISLSGIGTATIDGLPSFGSLCTTVDALPGVGNPCEITDATTVAADASLISALRVVISANEIGLVTCASGTPTTSQCLTDEPC